MSTSHTPTPHGGGGGPRSPATNPAGGSVDVKDHALGEVDDLRVEVGDELREVAGEARQHVGDIASTAAQELKAQADQQATRAGAGLEGIARQLSAMARSSDEQGVVPDLVASLGTQVEDLATRMQDGSFDEVVDDVRRFARRRPGLFLLAAAGAGFAASRVLRLTDISPSELTGDMGSTGTDAQGAMGTAGDATPPTGLSSAAPTGMPTRAPTAAPTGIPPVPTTPADRTGWSTPGATGGIPAGGPSMDAPGQQGGMTR